MSPELEAQKVIAISLGKIASSRVQRGGPKLCKNLLVANLIHKARTLVDDQFQCYYPGYEQIPPQSSDSTTSNAPVTEKSVPEMTEVTIEDDDMSSNSSPEDNIETKELNSRILSPALLTEYDDKENDSPEISLDSSSEISSRNIQTSFRTRSDSSLATSVPSRCLKRRNSCSEKKADYETHRSPSKRVRDQKRKTSVSDFTDSYQDSCDSSESSELPVDGMDVEQISTLVSAFSNGFRDFSGDSDSSSERNQSGFLWRSNSVPDMVLCAQQASSVLKMRQQTFETSTAVLA